MISYVIVTDKGAVCKNNLNFEHIAQKQTLVFDIDRRGKRNYNYVSAIWPFWG